MLSSGLPKVTSFHIYKCNLFDKIIFYFNDNVYKLRLETINLYCFSRSNKYGIVMVKVNCQVYAFIDSSNVIIF